jgi:hypothetical protein
MPGKTPAGRSSSAAVEVISWIITLLGLIAQ